MPGNTSAAVTKLIQVVATLIGSGDLRSLGDMSAVTKLILNGDVTHTPNSTSDLPKSIDANGFDITATSSIDVSGVVLSNVSDLEIVDGVTVTLSASQASSFNNSNNTSLINLNASGVAAVTAGGNLSALNLANVTLTLNAATTLPDSTAELPKSIDAGGNIDPADNYTIILSAGVDLSSASIRIGANLEIAADQNITMSVGQHKGFASITADGGDATITLSDAGTVTGNASIGAYALATAGGTTFTLGSDTQSVTTGTGGADTVDVGTRTATGTFTTIATDTIKLDTGADVQGVDSGAGAGGAFTANNLSLVSGASVTMTAAQNNSFSGTITAAGSETITLSDANAATGLTNIEAYTLANGAQTFTLGAASQDVTTGSGAVVIDTGAVVDITDAALDGRNSTTLTINVAADTDISDAIITGNLGTQDANYTIDVAANADAITMMIAQHALLGTVTDGGDATITLSDAGTVTGNANIGAYALATAGGTTFTLGSDTQSVTTGTGGADTVDVGTRTATGTFTTIATDTIKLDTGADVQGVDSGAGAGGAFTANNLSLVSGASVTMTAAQNNSFSGTITAAGSETITLSDANAATGLTNIEAYTLANGAQTFTLGAASQDVTTGSGAVVIDTGAVVDITDAALDGRNSTTLTINVAADTDISDAIITGNLGTQDANYTIDVAANADAITMMIAQHALLGTVTDGGDATITLSDAGTVTGNANIGAYALATAGGTTFTLGSDTQSVTTGTGGADTVDVGTRTATGTFTTIATDTIKLDTGADVQGVDSGAGAGGAFTANNLSLVSGASVTMTAAQNNSFSGTITAAGSETITLSDANAATGLTNIEAYTLANGAQTFTLGAASQDVTTGSGAVVIDTGAVVDITDAALDGRNSTTLTINVAADTDISDAIITGNLGTQDANYTIDVAANADAITMMIAQHALLGTVTDGGDATITLSDAGTVTGNANIGAYALATAGGTTFTLGSDTQSVTTGTGGADTVDVGTRTATGTFTTIATDTIKLDTGADVQGVDSGAGAGGAFTANNLSLVSGASVTMTAAQNNSFSGTITAAGSETITLSDANAATGLTNIEAYTLANGAQTFTLGAASQDVTTGSGAVVIDTGAVVDITDAALDGRNSTTLTINVAADTDISDAIITGNLGTQDANYTIDVAANADAITMMIAQHALLGTVTDGGDATITLSDAGTVTGNASIGAYALATAGGTTFTLGSDTQSVTTGTGGADTVDVGTRTATGTFTTIATDTIKLDTGADVQGVDSGAGAGGAFTANNLSLVSGASVTMTAAQNNSFSGTITAAGSETITLSDANAATGLTNIEAYTLANGAQTFTLGAASQDVTTGSGAVVIDTGAVVDITDAALDGRNSTTLTINVAADTDISDAIITGNLGTQDANYTIDVAANADAITMMIAQHALLGTVTDGGDATITLSDAGTVTGNANIGAYALATAGGTTFTLGSDTQSVTTGTGGADTVDVGTRTATGTFTTIATDTIKLDTGADVQGVDSGAGAGGAFTANNLSLVSGASVTMTAAQNNSFSGTITAAGSETITLSDANAATGLTNIEAYTLANGAQTFTLGAASQDVTTGSGAVVIDTGAVVDITDAALDGRNSTTLTINVAADTDISDAIITGNLGTQDANYTIDVAANADAITMMIAQHALLGTVTDGGDATITLSDAGTVTGNANIGAYALATAGGTTFTLGSDTQSVTTGTGGADTVDVGTRTATGTFTTIATDTIKLDTGADVQGVDSGAGAGGAFTANNLSLVSGASVTMTAAQNNSFSGTITAAGSETITLSDANAATGLTNIEAYTLANGAQTFTLGAASQDVTTGSGAVVIDTGAVVDITDAALDGRNSTTLTINVAADTDISDAIITGNLGTQDANYTIDVAANADAITMMIAQHALLGTVTDGGDATITLSDAGTVTGNANIGAYALATAGGTTFTLGSDTQSVTTGTGGADTVDVGTRTATGTFTTIATDTIKLDTGADVQGVDSGAGAGGAFTANNLSLVSGASVTMTAAQNNSFSGTITAAGSETITLSDANAATGLTNIEAYTLANGAQTFTLGAASQDVTTGSGAVVIDTGAVVDITDAALDGRNSTTLTINVAADTDISDAIITGNLGTQDANYTIDVAANADAITMMIAQHALLGTVTDGGDATITLSDAGTVTGNANIGAYALATAGGTTFTLGSDTQSVTTGTGGADTVDVGTRTATGTFTTIATDTIKLDTGADVQGVDSGAGAGGAFTANNLSLVSGASVTMTAAQNNSFSGTITAAGSETITLSDANAATGLTNIEAYTLANGAQTFTLGAASQDVTTGSGAVVIDTGAVVDITDAALDGRNSTTLTINVAADTDISDAIITGNLGTQDANYTIDVAANADAITMMIAQHALLGTVTDGGDATITLSDAGTVTGNASIGAYALATAGGTTFTLGSDTQSVTTGTGGADTVDVGTRTATGTFTTIATDTIKLDTGADVQGVDSGAGAGGAFTANNLSLVSGASVTMTAAQNNSFSGTITAAGSETITLSDANAATGLTNIEAYTLANGAQTFTLGAASQDVTTGSGAVVIDTGAVVDITDAALDGRNSTTLTINVAADTDISDAIITGNLGTQDANYTIDVAANADAITMMIAQHALLGTVTDGGDATITLSDAGTVTGNASIGAYALATAGGTTFTLGSDTQSVTTGTGGADTVDVGTRTATGTFTTIATDTIKLDTGADVQGVDSGAGAGGAFTANNLSLVSGASVTMTAAQNNSFSGTITAAGSETITLSDAGDVTAAAAIETYNVSSGGSNNVTVNASKLDVDIVGHADNVTTVTANGLAVTGAYTLANAADIIVATDGADISGVNSGAVTSAEILDLTGGISMTRAQHEGFATITASGTTDQITLSGSGIVTADADIETYNLGDEGRTIVLSDVAQNVTGGSGDDVIITGSLTSLTGDINGGGGTNKLVTGANLNISGAASFSNIQSIEIGGDFTLDVKRAQLDAIAITEVGGTGSSSVRISSDGANANQFDLSAGASLDISAVDVAVGFLDGADPSAMRTLVLGADSTLNLTAAQAASQQRELTIGDGVAAATVTVEELEGLNTANLTGITVDNLNAEVAVSGTTTLTGNLNNAALKITSAASTPILDLTDAASVDSIDFNNLELEVVLTTAQYTENGGMSVTNTTNAQTVQLINEAGALATVTQLSGIETYKLNATTAADDITFNALETDDSVDLTRLGHADATVTVSVDADATFDGTWSGFNAGDTLAISGTTITVNIESLTIDGSTVSLGGIDTITVDTGDTLHAAAVQLDAAGLTGDGTTVVRSLDTSSANLSSVNSTNVSLDVTAANASVATGFQLLGGRAYNVIGGNTLNLTAANSLGLNGTSSFVIAASTGLIADAADLDQVATSSDGTTTVRSLGTTLLQDLSELNSTTVTLDLEIADAEVGVGFALAGRAYNVIGTGELDLTNATLSTSASYVLGSGTDLRINAADVTNADGSQDITVTDNGSDSVVVVEAIEMRANVDLGSITASSLTASVTVADTVTLSGNLNSAALIIAGVSGTPVLDVTSAGTIGSLDFGNNAAKVIISATQYNALTSISNVATESQTIEIVDATNNGGTDALVTQVAGVEAYEINPTGANDDITFNLIATGASANLTRKGSTDATVTLSAGETTTFDGTWASFAAGDVLNIVSSSAVNVEGVSAGSDLGGLQTVDVGTGASFTVNAAQVSGVTITGLGTVNVTALDDTPSANLSGITASVLNAAVSLAEGETVSFAGNLGKAAVTISTAGDGSNEVFNVDSAVMGTASFTVNSGATLQGTAAQLNGVTATGDGTVAITAANANTAVNLSNIDATTTTIKFNGDGTFTGTLDGAVATVGDNVTMTAAANVVAGETINKVSTGALAVRIGTGDANVDLTSIRGDALSIVTVTDNVTFAGTLHGTVQTAVDAGFTLTTSAAKATGKTIVDGSGAATTAITALDDTADCGPGQHRDDDGHRGVRRFGDETVSFTVTWVSCGCVDRY